ncbi:unnamed protein product [Ceutorhynchus assimilis]|uniref:Uncharacterized protein n=1 Tax=Ceutorhynchus assimilis TaxID=467358 RepID=A0A9N9MT32_9CUCU|nr:unnamed protein product [Ceutorhynchus assimilis]
MSDTGEPGNGDVFEEAERALNIKIPEILKNLLNSCGYENEALIAGMTKATITEIEKFARTDLFQLIDEEDRAKYYGIYSKNPKIYKMLPAHQQVLLWMIEHFKKKRKSHKKEIQASAPSEAPANREGSPKKRSKTSVESSELLSDESQEEELHPENNAREITNQKPVVNRAVNLTDENALIFRNLKKWAKSKAKADLWETLPHKFDDIKIVTSLDQQEMFSKVTCFCNATYKLPKILKPGKKQKSWIYSNFHTHFMTKHFKTPTTSAFDVSTEISARPQQQSITSYLVTNDHEINPILNKKSSKVKILGNVVLSPSRAPASHSTNTLPKKLCDVYLDSRFQSAMSTAFGTASGTLSEANSSDPTEDHTGLFEANDRCLDSIDESTNTSSNQLCKIDNQDMDKVPSKWKRQKYQRHERVRRARENLLDDQSLITNYFFIAEKVSEVVSRNSGLADELLENISEIETVQNTDNSVSELPRLLKTLQDLSLKNSTCSNNRNRYDDATKKFAVYLFYIGGRLLYETLKANLENSLPSISTLNRFLDTRNEPLQEGGFDFKGLLKHLTDRGLPKMIWVSEDGTRVTGKIEYDSKSNNVIGLVLPLRDGLPQQGTFPATSAEAIKAYFQTGVKATYAYVIMAQPLHVGASTYCLSLFGTDNSFTTEQVTLRWEWMKKEAKKFGITIMGFSSDGDTRLLRAMRLNTDLISRLAPEYKERNQTNPEDTEVLDSLPDWEWYHCSIEKNEECYVQDTIHILTNMRTRFLKPGINLPIGKYTATSDHLRQLILKVSKDKHLLTDSDLRSEDKMNFASAEKMCNNLLTSNCYLCIEINAHALIKLILKLKSGELKPEMFSINIFGSQACESLFRAARSMTSTYSTIINFSIKDMLNRIERIKTTIDTINDLRGTFTFPREEKRLKDRLMKENLPREDEILNLDIKAIIEEALQNVIEDMRYFGLNAKENDWKFMQVPLIKRKQNIGVTQENVNMNEDDVEVGENCEENEIDHDVANTNNISDESNIVMNEVMDLISENISSEISNEDGEGDTLETGSINLKDFSGKVHVVSEKSPYIEVVIGKKTSIIKKSSYCWLLDQSNGRVSTDRLKRFIGSTRKAPRKTPEKSASKNSEPTLKKTKQKLPMDQASGTSTDSSTDWDVMELDDSDDLEEFSDEMLPCQSENLSETAVPEIHLENYYAVFYDQSWFIGRIIEDKGNAYYKIKFLKAELDTFIWPRKEDIDTVYKDFIFYGPINLIGGGPFELKRADQVNIKSRYKV